MFHSAKFIAEPPVMTLAPLPANLFGFDGYEVKRTACYTNRNWHLNMWKCKKNRKHTVLKGSVFVSA